MISKTGLTGGLCCPEGFRAGRKRELCQRILGFVGYDKELMEMTERAFMIYSVSFLFSGMAIYGSSFFTALNDGLTSALLSFLRSLLFQVAAVIILPLIFGIDGIWFSVVAAEMVAAVMTVLFIAAKRKKYHY